MGFYEVVGGSGRVVAEKQYVGMFLCKSVAIDTLIVYLFVKTEMHRCQSWGYFVLLLSVHLLEPRSATALLTGKGKGNVNELGSNFKSAIDKQIP